MSRKLPKTDMIELNKAYNEVLAWFFSFPDREIGLNDLAAAIHISKATARRAALHLIEEGFLQRELLGNMWRLSRNKDHVYNFSKKIAYNLMMVYESGILGDIHRAFPNPRCVVLFGSYRKGDDNEKSDIDIAIEVMDDKEVEITNLGILPKLGLRENVPVNLHIFSRNKIDLNLFANIANGIVLEGFLEARP